MYQNKMDRSRFSPWRNSIPLFLVCLICSVYRPYTRPFRMVSLLCGRVNQSRKTCRKNEAAARLQVLRSKFKNTRILALLTLSQAMQGRIPRALPPLRPLQTDLQAGVVLIRWVLPVKITSFICQHPFLHAFCPTSSFVQKIRLKACFDGLFSTRRKMK